MRRAEFDSLWTERINGTAFDTGDPQGAWDCVVDITGDDRARIDVLLLREILSRGNPPDEVVRPTVGVGGPVLGTIHGSKGREAEDVVLALTSSIDESDDAEEARIMYVAKGVRLEFGLDGDVDRVSPVERSVMSDADSRRLQDVFAEPHTQPPQAYWDTDAGSNYRRILRFQDDARPMAAVGKQVENDAWRLSALPLCHGLHHGRGRRRLPTSESRL
jgi:hypothetical protein